MMRSKSHLPQDMISCTSSGGVQPAVDICRRPAQGRRCFEIGSCSGSKVLCRRIADSKAQLLRQLQPEIGMVTEHDLLHAEVFEGN